MDRQFFSDYFTFTRRERNGIVVILVLIIGFSLLPLLYPMFIRQRTYDHTQFDKEIASLKVMQQDSSRKFSKSYGEADDYQYRQPSFKKEESNILSAALFEFDPNTISAKDWKRLGLKDKTIATIQNYLSKGGKFRHAEDIGKIWGLHEDEVERLLPFVKIASVANPYPSYKNDQPAFVKRNYEKAVSVVDINGGDSTAFVDLPGIGPGFARRIIAFRNKLGGFVSVDQIAETYGLPDSTFQKIKPMLKLENLPVKQFNINTATADELKQHPYIRYALANAIVQYRSQHGNFSSVNDIKKIMMITGEIYSKISPYLKTAD